MTLTEYMLLSVLACLCVKKTPLQEQSHIGEEAHQVWKQYFVAMTVLYA